MVNDSLDLKMTSWINLPEAEECLRKGRGRGIKVAILDSGIEADHPGLRGLSLADDVAIVEDGFRLKTIPGGGRDLFGHGTAIASIVRRLAPEALLGSFRVLGERQTSRTAIIQEGVRQALDRGYQILNCSFGCSIEQHVMHYKEWIDEAYLKGVHIVAACNNFDYHKREWPGYFPTVITVNLARSALSEEFYYRPGHLVEFAAPGENLELPWAGKGKKKVTGSSFAAPFVAAQLARLLSLRPDLPPLQAKALLHRLAMPWQPEIGTDTVFFLRGTARD